jgi:isoamylase
MHVDGFRFDLAATLARQFHEVDRLSAFFDIIQQDPIISQTKLIAEPWDVGDGGYQVGNFPPLWTEWNGKFRDTVRDFWRSEPSTLGEFASRITGSSDLYQEDGRHPIASINFVTAHDGFTLRDLVSYNDKHNAANGEDNNDGENHNRSWNCGIEGETNREEVLALRARQQRNFITTMVLSQGVPMLAHGDEFGRTQNGNNNVYCQDNELAWIDWKLDPAQTDLLSFTQRALALRHDHPVFRRRRFFTGEAAKGGQSDVGDIAWFTPAGSTMGEDDWHQSYARAVATFLNGERLAAPDKRGRKVIDDSFLILFNAHYEDIQFTLPSVDYGEWWSVILDTAEDDGGGHAEGGDTYSPGELVHVVARSVVVLRRPSVDDSLPISALNTGSRRAGSPGSSSTVRVRGDLAPPFTPRPIDLMPRTAPRLTPTPAPRVAPPSRPAPDRVLEPDRLDPRRPADHPAS